MERGMGMRGRRKWRGGREERGRGRERERGLEGVDGCGNKGEGREGEEEEKKGERAVTQWFRTAKNRDVSNGPFAHPLIHSLAPLTYSLAPHCLLCS